MDGLRRRSARRRLARLLVTDKTGTTHVTVELNRSASGFRSIARPPLSSPCHSEIRLVRLRYHGGLSVGLPRILGAYQVRPRAHGGPVRDGRRPGHGEDVFVLDREMELQHLAPVVGVEFPASA